MTPDPIDDLLARMTPLELFKESFLLDAADALDLLAPDMSTEDRMVVMWQVGQRFDSMFAYVSREPTDSPQGTELEAA